VISVYILCLDDCFATTIMPQLTEITQFIFGQPLSGVSRPDPDEDVLFDDREGMQPSLPRNVTVRIRRYSDALARPVVAQAVIGAFEQAASTSRPCDSGIRLCRQRSSKATALPAVVRHITGRFSAMTWPCSCCAGNSCASPATYQAFFTIRSAAMLLPHSENRRPRGNSAVGPRTRQAAYRVGGRRKAQKAIQPQR